MTNLKLIKILLLTAVTTLVLYADPAHNEQILGSSGGDAVAMDKEWAVVGDAANNKVHVYPLNYSTFEWDEANKIELTGPKIGDFGASVAIDDGKLVVGAPEVETWRMEAHAITIPATHTNPVFTKITLQRTYEEPPLIFALASNDGGQPSAAKIRNRTNNTFEIVHAEPLNLDGTHNAMNISYFAIERGDHVLPDGTRIYAGELNTTKVRYDTDRFTNGDTVGWETVTFAQAFSAQPMVLAQIQTMENETANVPSEPSEPWLTTAVQNVSTNSVELSLERSEVVTSNLVSQNETIAFLVMDVASGTFTDVSNTSINFESIYSDRTIAGWDDGCYTVDFTPAVFASNPLVVATKNTLFGADGGWLRRCSLSASSIGLTVDEDEYFDPERNHTTERAGILAFSGDFSATFKGGEAYLYEFDTVLNSWGLKEIIEPTSFNDDMQFGTAVAVHNNDDGTAEIVVGAPEADAPNAAIGYVYAYTFDGTSVTLNSTLNGNITHSKRFGASLDIKGDYLIVGSPDEQTPVQNDLVGAAYTYKFNGTNWGDYPVSHRIKEDNTNEKLGTHVAINSDGNVTLLASNPAANSNSYIYTNDGSSAWSETYTKASQDGGGVDIDDGIYLIAQRPIRLSFYSKTDGPPRPLNILRVSTGDAYTSVSLYKEQVVVNDPDNTQAVAIDVPCGIKPTYLVANEWAMVSVPCGDGTATIDEIFGDELGTGIGNYCQTDDPAENCKWVMYKQNGINYDGTSASQELMSETDPMVLGQGYWIISDQNATLKADDTAITTRTTHADQQVNDGSTFPNDIVKKFLPRLLAPGVDSALVRKVMVGNPYPRTFQWEDLYFLNTNDTNPKQMDDPVSAQYIYPNGFVYDVGETASTGQPYRSITVNTPGFRGEIKSYESFWIKLISGTTGVNILELPFVK